MQCKQIAIKTGAMTAGRRLVKAFALETNIQSYDKQRIREKHKLFRINSHRSIIVVVDQSIASRLILEAGTVNFQVTGSFMRKALNINKHKNRPVHERIYLALRRKLETEELKAGERLPSTSSLSRQLKVSKATVYAAFDLLRRDGFIETVPNRGSFAFRASEQCEVVGLVQQSVSGGLSGL